MDKYSNQIRAIRTAIKELERELVKAKEEKNQEWIEDVEQQIHFLSEAIETIKHVENLAKAISFLS